MSRWLPALLIVAMAVAPAPAGAADRVIDASRALRLLDDYPTPSEWAGIYDYQVTIYLCGDETPFYNQAMTDTLCAGEVYDPSDSQENCTGSYTPTSIDLTCTWSEDVADSCTANYSITLTGTRNGGSLEETAIIHVTYSGGGCGEEYADLCTRTVITGTRVAPAPTNCATPVEATSWGTIKALYR